MSTRSRRGQGRGLALLVLLVLAAGSCGRDRSVRHYRAPKEAPPAAEEAGPHPGGSPLTWEVPPSWEEVPPSPMRLASFSMPAGEERGDCSVVVLSGDGGGLAPNVNRWRGQVGLPELGEEEILRAARLDRGELGEFRVFRIENPAAPQRAFLAAVVPFGPSTVFVKLTAPLGSLDGLESDFLSFCRSLGVGEG